MNRSHRISAVSLVFLFCAGCQNVASEGKKPNIVILATGGTIAGDAGSGTQSAYTSGAVTIDTMLEAVPGIRELANIKGEQIANVGSQDISFDIMLKLARRINELLRSRDVDGIVVTHGTDTMEETAYFLNLVVKSDKPVVMVGSMRPSTAVSADGPLNLYNAVGVAADPRAKGRGVLVVMNDWIQDAHSLTKTSTTAVQTFVAASWFGRHRELWKKRFLQDPGVETHHAIGVRHYECDAAAACGRYLRQPGHVSRLDRLRSGQWREGHCDRRRRKRQHKQSRGPRGGECREKR